ncbi:MAG TPA: ATP-binding cassette domain-containing protein [Steroidobacteraceae bacterium]|nr:ATP-binding cassette domain-containing protein [Steroidobacteraceae bacterium]
MHAETRPFVTAADSSAPMLAVAGLRKRYGSSEVVAGVSLEIAPGECFGLLGPNGAGKTTTLRCCLGLTVPDAGTIELAGFRVPEQAREARAQIGVVPQFDNLDPDFTVVENLLVFGRYFGLPRRVCMERIPALLDFAGLSERAHARIDALSGGMKRRLTLARALINEPRVLFLDEPTTGLDPQARHVVWDRLKAQLAAGRTIVLTTHFMEEAERLCDRVAIMDRGVLIAEDEPHRLVAREIEPVVVEVHGDGVGQWAEERGRALARRVEVSGETAFCYCEEAGPVLASLADRPRLRALRRGATLEDVFLKLTGRDLRD